VPIVASDAGLFDIMVLRSSGVLVVATSAIEVVLIQRKQYRRQRLGPEDASTKSQAEAHDSIIARALKSGFGMAASCQKQKTNRHQLGATMPDGSKWQQDTKVDGCFVKGSRSKKVWMRARKCARRCAQLAESMVGSMRIKGWPCSAMASSRVRGAGRGLSDRTAVLTLATKRKGLRRLCNFGEN